MLTYNDEAYDIIGKIEAEALENGKFHIVLDCVNSADSRDSKPGKVVEGLGIIQGSTDGVIIILADTDFFSSIGIGIAANFIGRTNRPRDHP